jgi:hypothetical protein
MHEKPFLSLVEYMVLGNRLCMLLNNLTGSEWHMKRKMGTAPPTAWDLKDLGPHIISTTYWFWDLGFPALCRGDL